MNTLLRPPPASPTLMPGPQGDTPIEWTTLALLPTQPVHALEVAVGYVALLEMEHGRVWLTCDGQLEDYFLDAGQRVSFAGPALLRISAEGTRPATLVWNQHAAQAQADYPPPPAAQGSHQPLRVVGGNAGAATTGRAQVSAA